MDNRYEQIRKMTPHSTEWANMWAMYPELRPYMRTWGRELRNKFMLKPRFLFLTDFFAKLKVIKRDFLSNDIKISIQLKYFEEEELKKKYVYLRLSSDKSFDMDKQLVIYKIINKIKDDESMLQPDWYQVISTNNFIVMRFDRNES